MLATSLLQVSALLPVCGRDELRGVQHVFYTRTSHSLTDEHLWFSLVTKPVHSRFTRIQRLTCILAIFFSAMLINIWNFSNRLSVNENDDPVLFTLGTLKVSSYSLTMGIVSALLTIPVNVVMLVCFKKREPRQKSKKLWSASYPETSAREVVDRKPIIATVEQYHRSRREEQRIKEFERILNQEDDNANEFLEFEPPKEENRFRYIDSQHWASELSPGKKEKLSLELGKKFFNYCLESSKF